MPPPNDARSPLDRAAVLERLGGDEAFLAELLALYDGEFAEKSAALAVAIEAGDMASVRSMGHSLKGASANLSLPGLRQAAQEVETAGGDKNPAAARKALDRLNSEYRALKAFLG